VYSYCLFYYVLILFIVGEFVLFHFWIIDPAGITEIGSTFVLFLF